MLPWRPKPESEVTNEKDGRVCQAGGRDGQRPRSKRPGMMEEGVEAGEASGAACTGLGAARAGGRLNPGRVSAQVRRSGVRLPLQGGRRDGAV